MGALPSSGLCECDLQIAFFSQLLVHVIMLEVRGSVAQYLTVQLGLNWADIQQRAEEFELSIFLFAALLWQPSITSP